MFNSSTYILMPNLHTAVDGPIRLGSVIENPFQPNETIYTLDPADLPQSTTFESEPSQQSIKEDPANFTFWQKILQRVGIERKNRQVGMTLVCDMPDGFYTTYFIESLKDDIAGVLIKKSARVKRILTDPNVQHVYIVSGLKIAKGLVWKTIQGGVTKANTGPGMDVLGRTAITAGLQLNMSAMQAASSSTSEQTIVAYQLHIVKKGSPDAPFESRIFEQDKKPKFLDTKKSREKVKEALELSIEPATYNHLKYSAEVYDEVVVDVVDVGETSDVHVLVLGVTH